MVDRSAKPTVRLDNSHRTVVHESRDCRGALSGAVSSLVTLDRVRAACLDAMARRLRVAVAAIDRGDPSCARSLILTTIEDLRGMR